MKTAIRKNSESKNINSKIIAFGLLGILVCLIILLQLKTTKHTTTAVSEIMLSVWEKDF